MTKLNLYIKNCSLCISTFDVYLFGYFRTCDNAYDEGSFKNMCYGLVGGVKEDFKECQVSIRSGRQPLGGCNLSITEEFIFFSSKTSEVKESFKGPIVHQ